MKLRTLQRICISILIAGLALILVAKITASPVPLILAMVGALVAVILRLVFWKCPHCGRYLGQNTWIKHCPHCGNALDL